MFAVALMLSLLLCLLLASRYSPLKVMDAPNERSLHDTPTPRTGGVGIMTALFTLWGFLAWQGVMPDVMYWITASALLVAGVSFIDDLRELSPLIRIAVHGMAAAVLIASGLTLFDGVFGAIFSWFAIVWMLNLYNFMDGMDGFAGGMTLFGFGFLAVAGWMQGAGEYTMYASLIAAASLGFLFGNFPPAKIFMGDVGSATLGILAAAFGLWGVCDGIFDWWFPVLVFSPFVVDATVTIIRRSIQRERIWQAHRSHYYQRLVQLGWGHRKTVLAEYVVMLLAGSSALLALWIDQPVVTAAVMMVWSALYLMIAIAIHRLESGDVQR